MVTVGDINKEVSKHSTRFDDIRSTRLFVKCDDGSVREVEAMSVGPHPVTGEVGAILFTKDGLR